MLDLTINDKETIESNYKSFLLDLKDFLQQSDEKNILNYVALIMNRLHKGQFSKEGTITFTNHYNYLYLPSIKNDAVYVMDGICCCRHASSLLYDILGVLNINPVFMYILIDECGIWHKISPSQANHLVLLIEEDDKKYILDAANQWILQVDDTGELKLLDIEVNDTLGEYHNYNVENIGKILRKYYMYRDIGIETVYD